MEEIIEESAKKYADSIPQDDHKKDYCVVDFEAGANWALQNQWHDASKKLPEDNKEIVGRYFFGSEDKGCHDDKIVYCQTNGKNWFTDFGGIAFDIDKPDIWMPIPSLPEN